MQVAEPDVLKASEDADVLIFVVPHQFIGKICSQLKGKIKPSTIGISLIKVRLLFFPFRIISALILIFQGVGDDKDGKIKLISEEIKELLGIEVWALMGANLAPEVAAEKFCEATIGKMHFVCCFFPDNNGVLFQGARIRIRRLC